MPVDKLDARHILSAMVFWGQIQNYMMRVNLSILIVAMVKDPSQSDNVNATNSCPKEVIENIAGNFEMPADDIDGLFEWDELTRGKILGAFGAGYILTQIIGGRLTEKYGGKIIYGLGLFLTAFLTLLSPLVAKLGAYPFMTLRALQGIFEGVTFPALHAMTARWIPKIERSSFIARSYFGSVFGLIITMPLCGLLAETVGWASAFYIIGAITIIWFICWEFLVYDTPNKHPRISQEERSYINGSLGSDVSEKAAPVPWRAVLTSVPVYGLIIADVGNNWGLSVLGTNGPTYLKYMLNVDLAANGLYSGLPMLMRYLGGLFHSFLADAALANELLPVLWVRRVFNSICMVGPALALAALALPFTRLRCELAFAETFLCAGMFFNGAMSAGHFSTPTDIAPNFAGTVFGLSNTISGISGFVAPLYIGWVTLDRMTFEAWSQIFAVSASIYFVTNLFYFFMVSADVQPWNRTTEVSPSDDEADQNFLDNPQC